MFSSSVCKESHGRPGGSSKRPGAPMCPCLCACAPVPARLRACASCARACCALHLRSPCLCALRALCPRHLRLRVRL